MRRRRLLTSSSRNMALLCLGVPPLAHLCLVAYALQVSSDANTSAVFSLLDPQPGDVVLDLGCGA